MIPAVRVRGTALGARAGPYGASCKRWAAQGDTARLLRGRRAVTRRRRGHCASGRLRGRGGRGPRRGRSPRRCPRPAAPGQPSSRASAPADDRRRELGARGRRTVGRSTQRSRASPERETRRCQLGAKRLRLHPTSPASETLRHIEKDRPHPHSRALLEASRSRPRLAGEHELAGRVVVGHHHPCISASSNLLDGAAEHGEHAFLRAAAARPSARRGAPPASGRGGSSAPAATSALSSPSECPANAIGRVWCAAQSSRRRSRRRSPAVRTGCSPQPARRGPPHQRDAAFNSSGTTARPARGGWSSGFLGRGKGPLRAALDTSTRKFTVTP